jgi:hypothetical protein
MPKIFFIFNGHTLLLQETGMMPDEIQALNELE